MTFKHSKFDDSAVLRSLERVAVQKGLVKQEKITKSASELVGPDLSPTHHLSHDIVRLCSELRRSGLHKHADDIESRYVNYKRAQTLYEAFKETGEDLVDAAHPEGGHVLKDVEGKPEVMTIVERQQAALKMLSKEPTGKLSNAAALRALKLVFAGDGEEEVVITTADRSNYAKQFLKKAVTYINNAVQFYPALQGQTSSFRFPILPAIKSGLDSAQAKLNDYNNNYINNDQILATVLLNDFKSIEKIMYDTAQLILRREENKSSQTLQNLNLSKDNVSFVWKALAGDYDDQYIKPIVVAIKKKEKQDAGQKKFEESTSYRDLLNAKKDADDYLTKLLAAFPNSKRRPPQTDVVQLGIDIRKDKQNFANFINKVKNMDKSDDNLVDQAQLKAIEYTTKIREEKSAYMKTAKEFGTVVTP